MATTDEVWRLDTQKDADCLFFQKMSDHGHYGKRQANESRQGTYVFTADGKFLSSVNDLDPNVVLATLKLGLAKWNALPKSERAAKHIADVEPKHRWEDYFPKVGLALTGYSRDLPTSNSPTSERLPTWNRDSAWFSKTEVQHMVPRDAKTGQSFELSKEFVARICRLHLVDNVKGQTDEFSPDEIRGSRITAQVIERSDSQIKMTLSGTTQASSQKPDRGIATTLKGSATFNLKTNLFTQFEFVAVGHRWGKTRFNDRSRQLNKTPIGFSFQLADKSKPPVIPGMIWAYRTPWLPESP